jgi:Rrf2 family protein
MNLSTKSTYGLRAMLNIALESDTSATSIADISEREGISVAYLEQLLNKLRHAGLVDSIRGPKGGYVLSKSPRDITVKDIVTILEGGIYPVHCVKTGDSAENMCKRRNGCVPKLVWVKLAKAISDCLGSVTLEDLCIEAKKGSVRLRSGRI